MFIKQDFPFRVVFCFLCVVILTLVAVVTASSEEPLYQRRNFFGMHNLKDGGPSIASGMEATRQLVGGGFVFDWVFDFESEEGWLCGRYRKVYRQYLIPDGRPIPLAITECGVDIVQPIGWKNHFSEDEYFDQLIWYDGILREDDYVLGATIFALEIPGWDSFDIAPIVGRLADYVAP